MTERLYYNDSFLHKFEARILDVIQGPAAPAIVLDRSAFYPTSGGQNFDTGWIDVSNHDAALHLRVKNVIEDERSGNVLHVIEGPVPTISSGVTVRGSIDADRRRDHMQQHSGQHVLSAAFERLYDMPTVSFHMGEESCTIDVTATSLTAAQLEAVEKLANEVIADDRPVEIRFATPDEARTMGVRKIPAAEREKLRLIDIHDFDLNACGGTHVSRTGQIGGLLLRRTEKVKQGVRVEFVCGLRAVRTARRDFQTLTETASAFSTHIWELPQQAQKTLEEVRSAQKVQHRLLEEVAELQSDQLLKTAEERDGYKVVVQFFTDRDLSFIKMLAQKVTKSGTAVALLGCGGTQPSLVFGQSPGLPSDMGALMKQTVQKLGTRGGGARDMAQGGAPDASSVEQALRDAAMSIS